MTRPAVVAAIREINNRFIKIAIKTLLSGKTGYKREYRQGNEHADHDKNYAASLFTIHDFHNIA